MGRAVVGADVEVGRPLVGGDEVRGAAGRRRVGRRVGGGTAGGTVGEGAAVAGSEVGARRSR